MVSRVSRLGSELERHEPYDERNLPAEVYLLADEKIPRLVWSAWIPDVGERQIARPLRDDERTILIQRRNALELAMAPYVRPEQNDEVAAVISDMFSGYSSMRHSGEDAVGRVMCVMDLLREFPAWAIKQACASIHRNGFERVQWIDRDKTTRIEKIWPPTDAEIVECVERTVRLRRQALKSACALLEAQVELPAPPIERPSKAEIEVSLGRSIDPPSKIPDTDYAKRVAEDLAARKRARVQ